MSRLYHGKLNPNLHWNQGVSLPALYLAWDWVYMWCKLG